jgi:hypothetical protein
LVGLVSSSASPALANEAPAPVAEPPPDAPTEAEDEPATGVKLAIPVFRLAFGTAQSVEPGSLGGFAFDLVVGSRLLFQPLGEGKDSESWSPTLTGELGYSRRGGDFGSHDLTVGIGFGFQSMYLGLHLFETVTFGVDGAGRYGLRSTARVDTIWGFLFLDLGHEVGFVDGATTHELRGLVGIDVGLLIAAITLGSLFS